MEEIFDLTTDIRRSPSPVFVTVEEARTLVESPHGTVFCRTADVDIDDVSAAVEDGFADHAGEHHPGSVTAMINHRTGRVRVDIPMCAPSARAGSVAALLRCIAEGLDQEGTQALCAALRPSAGVQFKLDVVASVAIGVALAGHRSLLALSWPMTIKAPGHATVHIENPGELRELVHLMQRR